MGNHPSALLANQRNYSPAERGSPSATRSDEPTNHIYELCTYDVIPAAMTKYMAITKKYRDTVSMHGKLFGMWVTEVGGENQVLHMWEFESLEDRRSFRDHVASDPVWIAFLDEVRPLWTKQDNTLLLLLKPLPLTSLVAHHFYYSLMTCQWDYPHGNCPLPSSIELCGEWMGAFGPRDGHRVYLWRSESLDQLLKFKCANLVVSERELGEGKQMTSRLLAPASCLERLRWS